MTEEEKEAVEQLEQLKKDNEILGLSNVNKPIETTLNLIQKQQEEIKKKDKIIDEISKNPYNELKVNGILFTGTDIKQYFERKVSNV